MRFLLAFATLARQKKFGATPGSDRTVVLNLWATSLVGGIQGTIFTSVA